ncbi:MAG: hypothetical protein CVU43_17585 [Chloroflexi bacterium HGW-Chloroflexi-5]|nr:MAG: hypothetical protein CVU43_17585 [Chloroflexi bacterium HGW-Chloroflexi-5]
MKTRIRKIASRFTLHASLLLCSLLTVHSSLNAQQYGWVDYRSKIPDFPGDTVLKGGSRYIADFKDVFFIDDNEGWVTTSNGAEFDAVILHTLDGGETWDIQTPPSKCSPIWMLDKNTGYAGSGDGFIYKTTDGG